jgi:hypothetical protein
MEHQDETHAAALLRVPVLVQAGAINGEDPQGLWEEVPAASARQAGKVAS